MSSGKFVFISIAVLVLLSGAGCIDSEASGAPVNTPAPVSTEIVTATATPEPTPAPTETHWWDDDSDYNPVVIPANENLFDVEIEGIKYDHGDGWFTIYDENQNQIFEKSIYTHSNLNLPLEMPEQYNALIDQYGGMVSVTMEQIDDDRDGKFDRVAVKYVGDEGVLDFEMEYREGASIINYLKMYLYYK